MSDTGGFSLVLPHWLYWGWLAVMPLIMMALSKKSSPLDEDVDTADQVEEVKAGNKFTDVLDWISEKSGVFVSFWTVNAVCFYFFEVIMRYLFNQPTIWVHEASYLLFGMQYLLAGAFTLLHGGHVRVDVVYNLLPARGRVGMDIFTSMFFFLFALALALTSYTFFIGSFGMDERTIETWEVQYWPVKGVMLLGAVLILLAGISKLIKDVRLFIRMGEPTHE